MTGELSPFGRFVADVLRAQHRDQLMLRAAALAYTTLFSIVPLLTVALATVARVQPERAELVVRAMAAVLPFSPARVQLSLTEFAERTAGLGWIAVVVSALVTLYLFYQIEEVINTIWGVPQRRRWQWRLASLVAFLLTGPLLVTGLFSGLFWLQSRAWYAVIAPAARPLPLLFAIGALTALFRWVPHTKVPLRAAFVGAAVSSSLLALVHLGFHYYLDVAANLNVVYGSLAIVLFFLVSLFLFWLVLLLGAESSWVVGHRRAVHADDAAGTALRLVTKMARDGPVSPTTVAAILGAQAPFVLSRLSTDPAIVVRSSDGWNLARRSGDITEQEVRSRFTAGEDEPLADGESPTTLSALAKEEDSAEIEVVPDDGSV